MRKATRRMMWLAAASILPALAGCPSLSVLHPATPIPKGETAVALAVHAVQVDSDALGNLEVAVRHGFSDHLDAGFKVFAAGGAADVNVVMYRSSGFVLSLDPMLAAGYVSTPFVENTGNAIFGHATLNLLADVVVTGRSTLTLGLRPGVAFTRHQASDPETGQPVDPYTVFGTVDGPLLGGLLGGQVKIWKRAALGVEVDVMRAFEDKEWLWQATLALTLY